MKEKLKRVVTVFKKDGDEVVKDEIELCNLDLSSVQIIFNQLEDNPMYDCYEIRKGEENYFKERHNVNFNFNKYKYYLECHRV